MRNFMDITKLLLEAEKPKKPAKTDTVTPSKFDFIPSLDNKSVAKTGKETPVASPFAKQAGGNRTRKAAKKAAFSPEATASMSHIMSSGMEDTISDDEAARNAGHTFDSDDDVEPKTTENLPAVISTAMAKVGEKINPEWHQIKHLPGYLSSPIRALGRQVFGQFTDTPIEDIQMIGTIAGINPERDVRAVMAWIKKNGVKDDSASFDFPGGMRSDASLWKTKDYSFVCVHDQMGYYVYGWAGGRGVAIGNAAPKRLK